MYNKSDDDEMNKLGLIIELAFALKSKLGSEIHGYENLAKTTLHVKEELDAFDRSGYFDTEVYPVCDFYTKSPYLDLAIRLVWQEISLDDIIRTYEEDLATTSLYKDIIQLILREEI